MARSYTRGKATRKGGMLVRENPCTRAVSVNSLYSVPVRLKVASDGRNIVKTKAATRGLWFSEDGTTAKYELENTVRISSAIFSSKSPFVVRVLNTSGGYTTYQCAGQKANKIVFSRETSFCGNPAALYGLGAYTSQTTLIFLTDMEDQVDVTLNVVLDSTSD